jgi:hypothetical protein
MQSTPLPSTSGQQQRAGGAAQRPRRRVGHVARRPLTVLATAHDIRKESLSRGKR